MMLQSYDFHYLNRKYGCRLQIGGSDQWGNITAGIDLVRKIRVTEAMPASDSDDVFGMTFPLVTKADGTKFGKSEKGNLWLDSRKTSPYQLYQFFMQTSDVDALTFVKYFTFLTSEELLAIEESMKREPEKRAAQTALAHEVTRLVHGQDELTRAEKASQALFGSAIKELDAKTLLEVFAEAPSTSCSRQNLKAGIPLIDLLAESKLCSSKGAARKDLAGGGIYINNERITDQARVVTEADLVAGQYAILRKGKKTYHLISFS
jgi:tyrosyl-tRNA synthetase